MKIVFIGSIEFSEHMLKKLIAEKAEVVGVITREKSAFNADFTDLKPLADSAGVPCKYFPNVNSEECISWVKSLNPDVVFCFGWSYLIKKELLELTPMGVVGYHPSELPKNRGRHPSIWPLILGLDKTASTFFFMDEGADSGYILSQKEVDITFEDDAADLYAKLIEVAKQQIEEYLPQLESGDYPKIEQDHSKANNWRKRGRADGQIDFRMHSETIYNLVRGLTRPYVGAHIFYNDEDVKVWRTEIVENNEDNLEFGKVLANDGKTITVKTADGAIKIVEHEFAELPAIGTYL